MLFQYEKFNENMLSYYKKYNEKQARRNRKCTEPVLYPSQIPTVIQFFFVNMY